MKAIVRHAGWILVLAGVLWGYQGLTRVDLIAQVFGTLENIIDIILAIVALAAGYQLVSGKK